MRTPERLARIQGVLAKRQPDLTLLLEKVHKPHNLSAILRTCDAVGVWEVHAVFPEGRVPTYNETSAGSEKWVPVHTHPSIKAACAYLRARGFRLYATALRPEAVDFRALDYTQPTAFILGAEYFGISEEALAEADMLIRIPMYGMVQSLNVSVAAAVLLYEAQRQRAAAGFYDAPRLSAAELEEAFKHWCSL